MEQQPNRERQPEIQQRIITQRELAEWVSSLLPAVSVAMLFAGDRMSCIDEAAVIEIHNDIVSAASIAPEGEQFTGKPTIVGLYTMPEMRRRGFGRMAFMHALARCRERGYEKVRVDVLSDKVMRMIETLPEEDQQYLEVNYMGGVMDLLEVGSEET